MEGIPRKHHFVSVFYLSNFTTTGTEDGTLHVFDRRESKRWKTTPKNVAHERDYHAVDAGSKQDPMYVEKKLGEQFEGKWSKVVRDVIEQGRLPPDDDEAFGDLYQFAAFQAVRVPRFRRQVAEFMDQAEKARLREMFSTEEGRVGFRGFVDQLGHTLNPSERRKLDLLLRDDPNLDGFVEYANSDDYSITVDRTWHMGTMLKLAVAATLCFGTREWVVWLVAADAPNLVCSDSPVCLTWTESNAGPYPPGFGMPNTLVTVPLGRRLMLVSTLGETPPTRTLDNTDVAQMNGRTGLYADQVYSANPDFVWLMQNGQIGNASDFLKSLDAAPQLDAN